MANPKWNEKKADIETAIARLQNAQSAMTASRIDDAKAAIAEALKLLDKVTATDPGDGTGVRSHDAEEDED